MTIKLELTLFEDGHPPRTQAYDIPDAQLDLAVISRDLGAFDSPEIRELNNRRGQHKLIVRAGELLAMSVADFRDDRDGWNGERRAEILANVGRQSNEQS